MPRELISRTPLGIIAAVLIALASGCGGGSGSSSSPGRSTEAQPRDLARCPVGDLAVRDPGTKSSIGSGGTIYSELEVVSRSRRACTFSGVPTVVALGHDGKVIETGRKEPGLNPTGSGPHRSVVLEPDRSATFLIANYDGIGAGRCKSVTTSALRVTLPGSRRTKTIPYTLGYCPKPNAGLFLRVGRIE